MAEQRTVTTDVDARQLDKIADALNAAEFEIRQGNNFVWQASKKGTTATAYPTGKLVIQGTNAETLVGWLAKKSLILVGHSAEASCRIGSDESGKGDYFGPLVTAAVLVTRNAEPHLFNKGVRDSKKISDSTILKLALEVKRICPHSVVSIGPKRYNELQAKLKSVNRILGWAHARAIENILENHSCNIAVADQFGDESFIVRALMEHGRQVELHQRHRAEEDIAVAAASVLARDGFLQWLAQAARKYSFKFPKGASREVVLCAKEFVKRFGRDKLEEVAKLHFKTTMEVLDS
jgi:ribonuclease HIII